MVILNDGNIVLIKDLTCIDHDRAIVAKQISSPPCGTDCARPPRGRNHPARNPPIRALEARKLLHAKVHPADDSRHLQKDDEEIRAAVTHFPFAAGVRVEQRHRGHLV